MALYIKPPIGNISFHKLCEFVKKRFLFLQFIRGRTYDEIRNGIECENLTESSECLIEGTAKDKISHFLLRFLCASDFEMQTFFIQSETEFFAYRLQFYDLCKIRQILCNASKQSRYILQNSQHIITAYKSVLKSLIVVAESLDFALENKSEHFKVPFTSALKFVRERSYPLHLGYISVSIKGIKVLLGSLFEEILMQGINQMRSSLCMQELKDPRLNYLQQQIKAWFHSCVNIPTLVLLNKHAILEECLNSESKNFPLCMENLHSILRKFHRLKHFCRIQYTLFLKDIGMSCHEVLILFMKEYSLPTYNCESKGSICSHSWSDSKARYIYSIEHLYGKRGSGKNYKAHSCNALQSHQSICVNEGGCPFKTFDSKYLENVLKSINFEVEDIEDIKSLTKKKRFKEACCVSLLKKMSMSVNELRTMGNTTEGNLLVTDAVKDNHDISKWFDSISLQNLSSDSYSVNKNFIQEPEFLTKLSSVLMSPSDFYFILSSFRTKREKCVF